MFTDTSAPDEFEMQVSADSVMGGFTSFRHGAWQGTKKPRSSSLLKGSIKGQSSSESGSRSARIAKVNAKQLAFVKPLMMSTPTFARFCDWFPLSCTLTLKGSRDRSVPVTNMLSQTVIKSRAGGKPSAGH